MIFRNAVVALMVAGAGAPAYALEFCKTNVERGGQERLVQGYVDGAALKAILIEDDPIPGELVLEPAASAYTVSEGGAISLTPYRTGASQEGKDWQAAGSVATVFGGFALNWPRVYKDGKRIERTAIWFDAGGLRNGTEIGNAATRADAEKLFVTWGPDWYLNGPPGYLPYAIYDPTAQNAWSAAPNAGNLRVEIYDRKTLLGVATFEWPEPNAWTGRMVTQVNALRKVHADKQCQLAATLSDDPEDDEDF